MIIFKFMYKTIFFIGLIVLFGSCKNTSQNNHQTIKTNRSYDKIEQLKWLVGDWTNITPDQQSYEGWSRINDSIFTGHSYTTILNDTVFQENMTIQQNNDNVILIVYVPNQNNEKPVTFKMLPVENNVFTFVNEQHDFPNKISYTNPVKDSIHAWVEGQIDSTYKKMDFYFKRSE